MDHLAQVLRVNRNLKLVALGEEAVRFNKIARVNALGVAILEPVERLFEEDSRTFLHPVLLNLADSVFSALHVLHPGFNFSPGAGQLLFLCGIWVTESISKRHNLADQVEML